MDTFLAKSFETENSSILVKFGEDAWWRPYQISGVGLDLVGKVKIRVREGLGLGLGLE